LRLENADVAFSFFIQKLITMHIYLAIYVVYNFFILLLCVCISEILLLPGTICTWLQPASEHAVTLIQADYMLFSLKLDICKSPEAQCPSALPSCHYSYTIPPQALSRMLSRFWLVLMSFFIHKFTLVQMVFVHSQKHFQRSTTAQ